MCTLDDRLSALALMNDQALLDVLFTLDRGQWETTLEILLHLGEVERRKLHLVRGHSSLFAYCIEGLGRSESTAGRWIRAARCIRAYPQVYELLQRRELKLGTVSLLAGVIDADNARKLLDAVRGRTRREVERIVARYKPAETVSDRIVPIGREKPLAEESRGGLLFVLEQSAANENSKDTSETSDSNAARSEAGPDAAPSSSEQRQAADPPRYKLQFSASAEFLGKFEQVRCLLSSKYAGGPTHEQLFETLIEEYLDRRHPVRKAERRKKRQARREQSQAEPAESLTDEYTRHIPEAVRDTVWIRDGGCCTFVGPDGRRCAATLYLTVDHIEPFAAGGDHAPSNLRLLCGQHNQLAAEQRFGKAFMEGKRARDSRRNGNNVTATVGVGCAADTE